MSKILPIIPLLAFSTLLISCGSGSDQRADVAEPRSRLAVTTEAWTIADVPIAPAVAMANRYPRAQIDFPGGVTGFPDLVYSQVNGYRPLRLDMYVPEDISSPQPMVMYIHGGGWQGGHSRQSGAFEDWPSTLAMIASRGYIVTSINYRLGGEEASPAAIQDIKTALRWLRANAEEFGIDKDKFLVWGASAGGHLAALAGTSCGVTQLEPNELPERLAAESDCVQATIGWYGIYDLAFMEGNGGPGGYFLGQTASASPSTYVDESDGSFLLIHGANDRVADPSQSVNFQELLISKGVSSNIHIIPDVDHSYIGATPEATKAASILALEMSIAFIDEVFK